MMQDYILSKYTTLKLKSYGMKHNFPSQDYKKIYETLAAI